MLYEDRNHIVILSMDMIENQTDWMEKHAYMSSLPLKASVHSFKSFTSLPFLYPPQQS